MSPDHLYSEGPRERKKNEISSFNLTDPDLIVRGTQPSPNSSAWVFLQDTPSTDRGSCQESGVELPHHRTTEVTLCTWETSSGYWRLLTDPELTPPGYTATSDYRGGLSRASPSSTGLDGNDTGYNPPYSSARPDDGSPPNRSPNDP
ncbi:hypothetical protein BHE74_00047481 [Ensete ventricosum]|nr:hypothetical protein BHE74_00047481 [Ensete ventricosum]